MLRCCILPLCCPLHRPWPPLDWPLPLMIGYHMLAAANNTPSSRARSWIAGLQLGFLFRSLMSQRVKKNKLHRK
jgi:hypothetical protein